MMSGTKTLPWMGRFLYGGHHSKLFKSHLTSQRPWKVGIILALWSSDFSRVTKLLRQGSRENKKRSDVGSKEGLPHLNEKTSKVSQWRGCSKALPSGQCGKVTIVAVGCGQ